MKKQDIKKALNKVDSNTKIVEKFDKFCTTSRAEHLVIDVDRLGLNDLLKKYQLQYLKKLRPAGSETAIRTFIRSRLYKLGVNHDYTHVINGTFKRRKDINFSLPWSLTKEEIAAIWKNRSTKLGYADRMHRLEEHKINKWEDKHRPTWNELRQDLFPRTLIDAFLNARDEKLEEIRSDLSYRYMPEDCCKVTIRYYKGDEIVEEMFGHFRDPRHIIDTRPSYFLLKNKNEFIHKQGDALKNRAEYMYGKDFICLRVYCHNSDDRIGMWIV